MEYVRDVPRDDQVALEATVRHVRDHLAAVADTDDDPATRAEDVQVDVIDHPNRPELQRVVGQLDAAPVAPYLEDGHDPLAGVDPDLFAAEVAAAQRDEEVLRGQA